MFRPNVPCTIRRMTSYTGTGKRNYAPAFPSMCGIVTLRKESQTTSVRTDSSASKSAARSDAVIARLLFPATVKLAPGDMVTCVGITMTVQGIFPRHDVTGRFDHLQVELEIWKA